MPRPFPPLFLVCGLLPILAGAQTPTTVQQDAYVKASNTEVFDRFGAAVAVSGDTLVVGAPEEDSKATGVNGNQADNSASRSGAAYVYVRSGGKWAQQAYLKASNTGADDGFGWSVAISGDTIVVGAYEEDSKATGVNGNQADNSARDSGAAYVFVRRGAAWTQQAYLKASNTDAGDRFGWSVAVSGDAVVVGASYESSSATGVGGNQKDNTAAEAGAAYVFARSGTTWSQLAYLKASNTDAGDRFGWSTAISRTRIVVGAPREDGAAKGINGDARSNAAPDAGAVYVFEPSGATLRLRDYLKASNTDAGDRFGWSLCLSDRTLVVGAPFEDSGSKGVNGDQTSNTKANTGAAYVLLRGATAWSQQAYCKASNTDALDYFGVTVAVSGDTVAVGASGEDSDGTTEAHNGSREAGAAYVFARSGTLWGQFAYVKAGNPNAFDEFGYVLALSGADLVVGAVGEDSDGKGVNSGRTNNHAGDSGAAYLFGVDDRAKAIPFGAGCASVSRPPTLSAVPPVLGKTTAITVGGFLPNRFGQLVIGTSDKWFQFPFIPLPLRLGVFGAPNCTIYVNLVSNFPIVLDNRGSYSSNPRLAVPSAPQFIGVELFLQAWSTDARSNSIGLATSNALKLVLGR